MDQEQQAFIEGTSPYFTALAKAGADYFREYLAFVKHHVPAGATLLDAGCGNGRSTSLLCRAGFKARGLDPSPALIKEAQESFSGGEYMVGDLANLEFANQSFEAVAAYNALEHVADVPRVLSELLRVTKNGGLLLIHSPNLISVSHLLGTGGSRPSRSSGKMKAQRQLARLLVRNVSWILKRTISSRADFRYRFPQDEPGVLDAEATVYLNPLDVKHCLETLGAKIISYQEVNHLSDASVRKMVASRFLADHMGVIRIVARKGARYERQ